MALGLCREHYFRKRRNSQRGLSPIIPKSNAPRIDAKGYIRRGRQFVHREVWIAAHGPVPSGYLVHHINHDKTDNRLENLALMPLGEHSTYHNLGAKRPRSRQREQSQAQP